MLKEQPKKTVDSEFFDTVKVESKISKEEFNDLYFGKGLPLYKIAQKKGIGRRLLTNWAKQHFTLRTQAEAVKKSNLIFKKTVADFPNIAAKWHPTKNGSLTPDKVISGSGKRYWWKCPKGDDHEWETSPKHRIIGNTGCPYCVGQKVSKTKTLTITHPDLAAEWHPTKNGSLTPEQVSFGSAKKIWWLCQCGHEWRARIFHRTSKAQTKCSQCRPRKSSRISRITDENRLSITHPDLAAEWHPTKNDSLTPKQVSFGSVIKAWWLCQCGHEWETRIDTRSDGHGCPECGKLKGMFGPLPAMWEFLIEKTVKAFYLNYAHQFTGITGIKPDNVISFKRKKITKKTDYFDQIIDPKLNPYGQRVRECMGKYPRYCNRLIIPYLFGQRKSKTHPDLITGKKTPIDFKTFPELLKMLQDPKNREGLKKIFNKKKIQELEVEYQKIKEFADNPTEEALQAYLAYIRSKTSEDIEGFVQEVMKAYKKVKSNSNNSADF
ncbi:MAG: zinc-ribbon domain-containing protein [Promethearchaeota archaeon]